MPLYEGEPKFEKPLEKIKKEEKMEIGKGTEQEEIAKKREQEKDALFAELLKEAESELEEIQKDDEQHPELLGERFDGEYDLVWQFFNAWDKKFPFKAGFFAKREKVEEARQKQIELLKQALPTLYQEAVENYKKFVSEDRWDTAEDWEMTEQNQFLHLIKEVQEEFYQRLEQIRLKQRRRN